MKLRFLLCAMLVATALVGPAAGQSSSDQMTRGEVLSTVQIVSPETASPADVRAVAEWSADPRHVRSLTPEQWRTVREWLTTAAASRSGVNVSIGALPSVETAANQSDAERAVSAVESIDPSNATDADVRRVRSAYEGRNVTLSDRNRERVRQWASDASNASNVSWRVAAPAPATTATTTPTETTATDDSSGASSTTTATPSRPANATGQTIVRSIDPTSDVVSLNYADGKFELKIRSDIPKRITISEGVGRQSSSGDTTSGRFAIRKYTLDPGVTTVTIPAEKYNGVAMVTVTTTQCANQGSCPFFQSGGAGPSPYQKTGPVAGWVGGASVVMLMMLLAAYRVKNKDLTDPEPL